MHVRYLQHSSHGTVQLLLMPLSAGIFGSDSQNETKTNNSEDENETEPIPLPIQSFLWRQTNPFLGSKINKLQDASCVTFERVIVQNILHGLSPSLSEAISSISRWNLVRASFPHIIQCSATLLTERAGEEESLAMSSSLVKILYILHWLLIDANVECLSNEMSAPSTNTSNCLNVRQFTYPISSIQLFVYLLAPLFHVVHEEEIEGHIRLESGFRLWTALWQQRLPELICFSAPVKQRRNHLPLLNTSTLLPWTKRTQSTAADQGIVRSVSDYKSSAADQQSQQELNNLRKSRTTTNAFNSNKNIENSPDSLNDESFSNGIQKIDDLFHYSDDGGFSSFNLSLTGGANAPIVKMNEICSGASIDSESQYLTWADLQQENPSPEKIEETNIPPSPQKQQPPIENVSLIKERRKSILGLKRSSVAEQKQEIAKQKEDQQSFLIPKIDSDKRRRRISANTLPIKQTKKVSRFLVQK
uniref:Cation channel complex component UNC80 N-terminal domain-containing protein n=1 Tax=Meloidogyne javanica TaxID=6303 RepID=A0A915MA77_MELJA